MSKPAEDTVTPSKGSPSLEETKAKRAATVDKWGSLPYSVPPVLEAIRESERVAAGPGNEPMAVRFDCEHMTPAADLCLMWQKSFPGKEQFKECLCRCHRVMASHIKEAGAEARDSALANAAMLAHDMGHPDVRHAINQLIPEGPRRPSDAPPRVPTALISRLSQAPAECESCGEVDPSVKHRERTGGPDGYLCDECDHEADLNGREPRQF